MGVKFIQARDMSAGSTTVRQAKCDAASMNFWGCSSAGRAPALQAGGQEFDSPHLHNLTVFLVYLPVFITLRIHIRGGYSNEQLTLKIQVKFSSNGFVLNTQINANLNLVHTKQKQKYVHCTLKTKQCKTMIEKI